MNMDDALQTFFVECRELLEEMDAALLGVLQEEDPSDSVNAIFRAAHTIKGSAGLFGLDFIVAFAHVAESVLDKVRAGALPLDDAMVTLLLACRDHVGSLVDAAAAGHTEADDDMTARAAPLLVQLHRHLGSEPAPAAGAFASPVVSTSTAVQADAAHWHISLRFGTDVLRNGMDPLSFLRYLNKLGTVTAIATVPDALPALAEMDAESCYLGFELALQSTADRAAIEGAFEFVQDDCAVRIVPPGSPVADYLALLGNESAPEMGRILVHCRSLTQAVLDAALAGPTADAALDTAPVADGQAVATSGDAAAPRLRGAKEAKAGETQSVRVDADKLDRLVDLVGPAFAKEIFFTARRFSAEDARIILVCVHDPELSLKIVDIVKREFPLAKIFVRAITREHAIELQNRNVEFEVRETFESAMQLGHAALRALGFSEDRAAKVEADIRRRDFERALGAFLTLHIAQVRRGGALGQRTGLRRHDRPRAVEMIDQRDEVGRRQHRAARPRRLRATGGRTHQRHLQRLGALEPGEALCDHRRLGRQHRIVDFHVDPRAARLERHRRDRLPRFA